MKLLEMKKKSIAGAGGNVGNKNKIENNTCM